MNELLRQILFLPPQATALAAEVDYLHYFVALVTIVGSGMIPLLGGYFLYKYRRPVVVRDAVEAELYLNEGREAGLRPKTHPVSAVPLWVELVVVVFLLSIFLLWWVIGFRQYVALRVAPENSMKIYAMGKKWMWKFDYPNGGASIATLYVPANRPVELVMTSRDVLHSFFIPDFRVKHDVIPGRYTTLWFEAKEPGVHDVFCTEYCGTGHSMMRGRVVVLSPEDYERWLAGEKVPGVDAQDYREPGVVYNFSPKEEVDLVEQGKAVSAQLGCLRCHSVDGSQHIGPSWAGVYGTEVEMQGGMKFKADEAYLTESMMDPNRYIRAGYQPQMPTYQGVLKPTETAAILEYIKSLRSYQGTTAPATLVDHRNVSAASQASTSVPAASTQAASVPAVPSNNSTPAVPAVAPTGTVPAPVPSAPKPASPITNGN